jgi:dihydroflavonol-4-reductase
LPLWGGKPPGVKLPIAPLFPIAAVAELGGMLTGKEPFVTLDALKMARHRMYLFQRAGSGGLGYTPGLILKRCAMPKLVPQAG